MKASSLIFMLDSTTSSFSTLLVLIRFIATIIMVRVSDVRVKIFRVKAT